MKGLPSTELVAVVLVASFLLMFFLGVLIEIVDLNPLRLDW